jgi:acetylornithine/N-succinyldiaminopimelate aminotransferase
MTNWQELEHKYYMQVIKRIPLTLVRGKGVCVWDDQGRVYLDFVGGLAVNCLGHSHPVVVQALSEQAGYLIQTCNQFYTVPQVKLAQLLVENSCLNRVFLCNSGAEANEGAVKLARRYGKLKLGGAYEVITTLNSFHGRTLAMVAATGQVKFQEPYTPLPAGFVNVAYNDVEAIKAVTNERTCAVMLEPIQGEGGVIIPGERYFAEVADWCQKKGLLLILDEIQTGLGRTGSLFAYQQLGVEPDIMTLAKGLGSGVPIGAVLAKEEAAVFSLGDHGSTYGGNPLTCAVGYAVVKYIVDWDIAGNARQMGQRLLAGLEELGSKFNFVAEARGRGLLVALEFKRDMAEQVLQGCLERGLLVNQAKPNIIRFIPPLIVTKAEVDEALAILEEALALAEAKPVANPEK